MKCFRDCESKTTAENYDSEATAEGKLIKTTEKIQSRIQSEEKKKFFVCTFEKKSVISYQFAVLSVFVVVHRRRFRRRRKQSRKITKLLSVLIRKRRFSCAILVKECHKVKHK